MTPLKPIENLFAVEVREDFVHGNLIAANDTVVLRLTAMNQSTTTHSEIALPPGSYEILFTTSNATEQQAAGVVEGNYYPSSPAVFGFEDYEHYGYFSCETAFESLQSLLRANGLKASNYLLVKKTK